MCMINTKYNIAYDHMEYLTEFNKLWGSPIWVSLNWWPNDIIDLSQLIIISNLGNLLILAEEFFS